jgi:hypothetical protein
LKEAFLLQYDHFRGSKAAWKKRHLYVVFDKKVQNGANALPDRNTLANTTAITIYYSQSIFVVRSTFDGLDVVD